MTANSDVLLVASGLCRSFGKELTVRDVSLTLRRGDILGLLGLNGAGKSTTLRVLCGVLVADAGDVHITGLSLSSNPLKARAQLGYLPDQPPLYLDMRVRPYLNFCARLRRVPRKLLANKLERVIERCGLGDVQSQRIAHLSKGYKQRVGLAQALVHEPAVVLLDEPSNGLDPQQMQNMRELIKELGRDHAIVFSTHLLGEAQAVCNRIAVLHQGRLIADQPVVAGDNQLESLFTRLVQDDTTHSGTEADRCSITGASV